MKVEYVDNIERRTAFSRKMYCALCGSHEYEICEQLKPMVVCRWFVRCPQCGAECDASPARNIAITQWKQMKCD